MQIKSFVIKPTHRNGFLATDLMVLIATGMDFRVIICRYSNLSAVLRISIVFCLFFGVFFGLFVSGLLAPKSERRNGA